MKSNKEVRWDLINELRHKNGLTTSEICEVMNAEEQEVDLALNRREVEELYNF